MNTPVNFEFAKLLKEKGFDKYGYLQDVWLGNKYEWRGKGKNKKSVEIPVFGLGSTSVLPTIGDVVMWLYEKHSLWILILPTVTGYFAYKIVDVQLNPEKPIERPPYNNVSANDYNSPTEAYKAAIEYTLKNLIK